MKTRTEFSRRQFLASASATIALATLPEHSKAATQAPKSKGENKMKLTPYLLLDGTCKEAMKFYQACLGGELNLTLVKDSPAKSQMSAAQQNKVLNAHLSAGPMEISASDWLATNETATHGNTVCMFLSGGTLSDLKVLFEKLSKGANVTNPLQSTFFGTYGALNDKFGLRWMFAGDYKAEKPD
jgi:PhnB protein